DFPPDVDSTSKDVDEWIADAYVQWLICSNFWREAGVKRQDWNDVEYALLARLPSVDKGLLDESCGKFNELVHRAHKYSIPNLRPVPLDTPSPSPEPSLPIRTPAPPRTKTPPPASRPTTPPPHKQTIPAPRKQQSLTPVTPQRAVPQRAPDISGSILKFNLPAANRAATTTSSHVRASGLAPINIVQPPLPRFTVPSTVQKTGQAATSQRKVTPKPSGSSEAFQKDWTSPLHSKSAQQLKTGPQINAPRSEVPTRASSLALAVDAAARPTIIRGPDPTLGLLREGNVLVPSSDREPLFLPGTDDEEDPVQEDLVETGRIDEEVAGTDGEDRNIATGTGMNIDDEEGAASDEDSSPIPTLARRLRKPRIEFVFDEVTGDLLESHPTIFLSRPTVPPSQSPDLRRSARSRTSPVNPDAAYLKLAQGSNPDAKKKKKKAIKSKDKVSEVAGTRKRTRNEDDGSQALDKPVAKKLKSKGRPIDEVEVVRPTPVVRRRGPGLSKPPPVSLGVSGGGFGEKVPSTAEVVNHGIKSISVLKVDNDFGEFVEVDKSYWSKAVAPFVGERYTTACDHCWRLGTQCRKLLTHTVKCVRCHYSKLPCKVDGVAALNPIDHYRPKGSGRRQCYRGQ
ncbi:hypothetical protein ARMGADRAFT_1093332, partial [Armillaria gallica]